MYTKGAPTARRILVIGEKTTFATQSPHQRTSSVWRGTSEMATYGPWPRANARIPDRNPTARMQVDGLDQARRHQVLRGRAFRAGAAGGLGSPLPTSSSSGSSTRLPIRRSRVGTSSEGLDGASRSSAPSGETHKRDHGRARQQSLHHAIQPDVVLEVIRKAAAAVQGNRSK